MEAGRPGRALRLTAEQRATLRTLQLLTTKPVLYLCNVEEAAVARGNELSAAVAARAAADGVSAVIVSAAIEAEIAALPREERLEYLHTLGLERPGLERVIVAGYRLLDLITFFTAGPKEASAWTIRRGTTAPDAAGVIHSDFKRGFICAEVGGWEDFVRLGGEAAMREAGKLRQEGRGYVIQDGEVVRFRFNV
jgi:ribosome-binding ATPase